VKGIDLEIADHEFCVLVGPSGCGKSTTLRMIAGLEEITSGEIAIGGTVVNDIPPRDRDIAMVFQNYALYPHMSVYDNMAFGLTLRKFAKDEIKRRVDNAARILDIVPLLERKPKALSGGQRQRVAMGRAIVRDPKVFLFDEPLSNLDAQLRVQMRTEIKKVHQTGPHHHRLRHPRPGGGDDARRPRRGDERGVIEQVGPPQELYHRPATRFVAGFIGSPSDELHPRAGRERLGRAAAQPAERHRPAGAGGAHGALRRGGGQEVLFGIRPEHLTEPKNLDRQNIALFELTPEVIEPMGWRRWSISGSRGRVCSASTDDAGRARPPCSRRRPQPHAPDRPESGRCL
jgi:multiple sugar transport system ATP-binding protein